MAQKLKPEAKVMCRQMGKYGFVFPKAILTHGLCQQVDVISIAHVDVSVLFAHGVL